MEAVEGALREAVLSWGAKEPFAEVAKDLQESAGVASSGKNARREISYFEENEDRMRYARFKVQGYFVGSGVIEAGCKTIVAQRLKRSAVEWTVRGSNAIIAMRCTELSGRTEHYWEPRTR